MTAGYQDISRIPPESRGVLHSLGRTLKRVQHSTVVQRSIDFVGGAISRLQGSRQQDGFLLGLKTIEKGQNPEKWQGDHAANISGFQGFPEYPAHFQVPDFPNFCSEATITANNNAFFFCKKQGERIALNTDKIQLLIDNLIKNKQPDGSMPRVTLRMDADLFENRARYIDKYQSLRPEQTEHERRAMLGEEAEIINHFIANPQGLRMMVKESLRRHYQAGGGFVPPEPILERQTQHFLKTNLRIEGVVMAEPLEGVTWDVITNQGHHLVAKQDYTATSHPARPMVMGTKPALIALAGKGHPQASYLLGSISRQAERTQELVEVVAGQGFEGQRQLEGAGRGIG